MSRGICAILAIATACTAAAPSHAAELAPAGKWIVNFADSQCLASRLYGTGDDQVSFLIKLSPMGNVAQIALVTKGYTKTAEQYAIRIHLGEAEPINANLLAFGIREKGKPDWLAHQMNFPADKLAQMELGNRIRFESGRDGNPNAFMGRVRDDETIRFRGSGGPGMDHRLDVTLAPMQLKKVIEALRTCIGGLREIWNVPTSADPMRRPARAKTPLRTLFSPNDYPTTALLNEQDGSARFVLLIDERGSVADCTLEKTSGIASLDAQSCAILKSRAQFEPATDRDGRPAKSTAGVSIVWRIRGN